MRRDAMLLVGDGGFNKFHGRKKKIKWGSRRTCRALLISGCPSRPRIMLKVVPKNASFSLIFRGCYKSRDYNYFRLSNEYNFD